MAVSRCRPSVPCDFELHRLLNRLGFWLPRTVGVTGNTWVPLEKDKAASSPSDGSGALQKDK